MYCFCTPVSSAITFLSVQTEYTEEQARCQVCRGQPDSRRGFDFPSRVPHFSRVLCARSGILDSGPFKPTDFKVPETSHRYNSPSSQRPNPQPSPSISTSAPTQSILTCSSNLSPTSSPSQPISPSAAASETPSPPRSAGPPSPPP